MYVANWFFSFPLGNSSAAELIIILRKHLENLCAANGRTTPITAREGVKNISTYMLMVMISKT